jgi:hypothetical protein
MGFPYSKTPTSNARTGKVLCILWPLYGNFMNRSQVAGAGSCVWDLNFQIFFSIGHKRVLAFLSKRFFSFEKEKVNKRMQGRRCGREKPTMQPLIYRIWIFKNSLSFKINDCLPKLFSTLPIKILGFFCVWGGDGTGVQA